MKAQDHEIEKTLDMAKLVRMCKPALDEQKRVIAKLFIKNTDRVTGTILGSEISRRYGDEGLPEDTISLSFVGSAGQSFGAFIPKGLTLTLEGDANDYVGKGLSGGKIIIYPPREATFRAEDNVIIGNVAFFGATSGEAFVSGKAGERFCVRNSGARRLLPIRSSQAARSITASGVGKKLEALLTNASRRLKRLLEIP